MGCWGREDGGTVLSEFPSARWSGLTWPKGLAPSCASPTPQRPWGVTWAHLTLLPGTVGRGWSSGQGPRAEGHCAGGPTRDGGASTSWTRTASSRSL